MADLDKNTILIKRSNMSGVIPALSSLEFGELGINTVDGKLFTKTESNSLTSIKTFLNSDDYPYTLNHYYSSINFKYGNNTVNQIFAGVLGGYNNDISGGGSTVINGEDNDIAGDFSLIGNGLNNKITINGDYGAILGGQNNNLNHQESFIIGSNITSHLSGFTYVNNLSVLGNIYGDGSQINGIASGGISLSTVIDYLSTNNVFLSSAQVGPQEQATATLFARGYKVGVNTESPNHALTVVGSVSATGSYYGDGSQLTGIVAGDSEATTLVRSNSANWELSYTTVQTNSAEWASNGAGLYLPLSGGDLTGSVTSTSIISSNNIVYASNERVVISDAADTTPVYKIRALTQMEYNALGTYDDNTIYFIKQ